MDLSLVLAACLISLIGLPHGALDPVIAHRHGLIKGPGSALGFTGLYLAIVGSVISVWLWLPSTTLTIFLLISAWHFGRDWRHPLKARGFGYGAFVLGLPSLIHPTDVQQIFEFLLFGESPIFTIRIASILGVTGIIILALEWRNINIIRLSELLGLAICAWIFSPLWYFVIYFCALHSPRHLIPEFRQVKPNHRLIVYLVMLTTTIATLVIAVFAGAMFEKYYEDLNTLSYQLIFIGLAGLTVPHMLLLEWTGEAFNE